MNDILHAAGTRLVKLRQKLAARSGVPGYEKNCEALRAEIARLEGATLTTSAESAANLSNQEIAEYLIGTAEAIRGSSD